MDRTISKISHIRDILIETVQEIAAVKKALEQVLRLDPETIPAIFNQSLKGSPEVRQRTINFLSNDLNRIKMELSQRNSDWESKFSDEVKKVCIH